MGGLGTWLALIIGPLAKRVLLSIGVGTVTYAGLTVALNQALSAAKGALGGMSGDLVQIMALAGMFDSMAIIAGGMVAALSFMIVKRFTAGAVGA